MLRFCHFFKLGTQNALINLVELETLHKIGFYAISLKKLKKKMLEKQWISKQINEL